MVEVQERLKINLLEELNEIPYDHFEAFELKIERLEEIPIIEEIKQVKQKRTRKKVEKPKTAKRIVTSRKSGISFNPPKTIGSRNRGLVKTKTVPKYTMDGLFKVRNNTS